MKVCFISLGCDKNLTDSEHMLGILKEAGYSFTDDENDADIVIINTCGFIGDAKKESIDEILRIAALKENGTLQALVVTGCLAERYASELEKEIPEIDGALGIASWDRIAEVVSDAVNGLHPHVFADHDILCTSEHRVLTTGGHYAYLKIAEGCDKRCTYCVIPYVRGAYRSVPMEQLLKEAETLTEGGVRELILVAQETTLYGTDLYGKKMLPELLKKLSGLPELQWIRILYCYPEEITKELIDEIRDNPKVVHYLDMPVQHASDAVLKRMGRKTTGQEFRNCIRMIREEIPDMVFRTTMITGFPGETEEDFEELKRFVSDMRFDRLGVFAYSREENTPADRMNEQIPERIKKKRRKEIMLLQQQIAFAAAENKVGSTVPVMVEGRITGEEDVYVGRTYMDAPDVDGYIFINSHFELMSGDFIRVKITKASGYDLIGEIVE